MTEIEVKYTFRQSISSGFDTIDHKLVLFIPKEREDDLTSSLKKKLKGTIFEKEYRTSTIDKEIKIYNENGLSKCGSGTKMFYMDQNEKDHYSTCGVFVEDEYGRMFAISSCHGNTPDEYYIMQPSADSKRRGRRQRCRIIEHVYQKSPLLDAVLLEIDNEEVKSRIDTSLHKPTAALCGQYTDLTEKLGANPNWATVMRCGGPGEITRGKLSLYGFRHSSRELSDALVITPMDCDTSFSEEGDSGSLVFCEYPHEHPETDRQMTNFSLYQGLALVCHGIEGLYQDKKGSLAFRLDDAIGHFKKVTGKNLRLLPFDHPVDF